MASTQASSLPLPHPRLNKMGRAMREMILVYGLPKIGKTHLYFTIALWHQQLGSPAKFYGINTDESYGLLMDNPEFEDLENIVWVGVTNFQAMLDAAKQFNKVIKSGDWLSIDLMDSGWAWAQDEYAHAQAGKGEAIDDIGDLFKTEGPKDGYPIGGWEWGMPNARYRRLANNQLVASKAHLFLVSGEKDLPKESQSGDTDEMRKKRKMFGHVGAVPEGQKGDPYRYHTILNVQGLGPKKQGLITAGERSGRREWLGQSVGKKTTVLRPQPIDDFFVDYLVGVGGWAMS